ncbi:MAG: hypothetical protein Q8J74_12270 [Candidatus Didemnitutus sp.]|nr:hypothetical protein [Candidatus Didemnitutus sp.]
METKFELVPAANKFGTLGGVFIPNVLTMLGVIMFLRTGWVVGQAGLKDALIILCIANAITLLTRLSLSAIATNRKVGGSGTYFLISRSVGRKMGGSAGLPLFLVQAVSVAFYIIGFTESLHFIFSEVPDRLVSGGVLAGLFVISWIGADLAIKTQDCIMAGVGMSGDVREPSKSIPRGPLTAGVVTYIGLSLPTNELAEPLERDAATVLGIKGNIFLAQNWEDLD